MKFVIERNNAERRIKFSGEIPWHVFEDLKLDRRDWALLDDVSSDEKVTAADCLLVLEMIFRRHAEQQMPNTKV